MVHDLKGSPVGIGLPPNAAELKDLRDSTFVKFKLTPCLLNINKSIGDTKGVGERFLKLFELVVPDPEKGWKTFKNLLNNGALQGLQTKGLLSSAYSKYSSGTGGKIGSLYINGVLEGAFTDTFSNEFELMFAGQLMNKLLNNGAMGSIRRMASQASQIFDSQGENGDIDTTGGRNLIDKFVNSKAGKGIVGGATKLAAFMGKQFGQNVSTGDLKNAANKFLKSEEAYSMLTNKINFPKMWRGSAFGSDVSITVRLYNPYPANDKAHMRNIIIPLAFLITLVAPKNDSTKSRDVMYDTPLYCKLEAPGLHFNPFGAISNMTVTLGGSNGSIGVNQRPSVVDVKISFAWMYSILSNSVKRKNQGLINTSVNKYLKTLSGKKDIGDLDSSIEGPRGSTSIDSLPKPDKVHTWSGYSDGDYGGFRHRDIIKDLTTFFVNNSKNKQKVFDYFMNKYASEIGDFNNPEVERAAVNFMIDFFANSPWVDNGNLSNPGGIAPGITNNSMLNSKGETVVSTGNFDQTKLVKLETDLKTQLAKASPDEKVVSHLKGEINRIKSSFYQETASLI